MTRIYSRPEFLKIATLGSLGLAFPGLAYAKKPSVEQQLKQTSGEIYSLTKDLFLILRTNRFDLLKIEGNEQEVKRVLFGRKEDLTLLGRDPSNCFLHGIPEYAGQLIEIEIRGVDTDKGIEIQCSHFFLENTETEPGFSIGDDKGDGMLYLEPINGLRAYPSERSGISVQNVKAESVQNPTKRELEMALGINKDQIRFLKRVLASPGLEEKIKGKILRSKVDPLDVIK